MNPYWIAVAFSALLQFVILIRWLHRRMRDDEIHRAFVRDMAVNHLPHLYHALSQIASQLDIELSEPPPLRFIELNGRGPDRRH